MSSATNRSREAQIEELIENVSVSEIVSKWAKKKLKELTRQAHVKFEIIKPRLLENKTKIIVGLVMLVFVFMIWQI